MKKIKIVIALALVAATAFSLTSCLSLDEAKAHHMKFTDDTFETISFAGKTYKKLPNSYSGCEFNTVCFDDDAYWLTKEDVPVLLSKRYGIRVSYDSRHEIIGNDGIGFWIIDDHEREAATGYYTTEEHYEEYKKMLDEPELVTFTTTVLDFDPDVEEYGYYKEKLLILSGKAADLLNDTIENGDKADRPDFEKGYYTEQTFCRSTADGFVIDSTAYIVIDSDVYGFWLETPSGYKKLSDETAKALEPYLDENSNHVVYYD